MWRGFWNFIELTTPLQLFDKLLLWHVAITDIQISLLILLFATLHIVFINYNNNKLKLT